MEKEVRLFPSDRLEAFAFAYVQKTADSSVTPEDFVRLYWEAYYRIGNSTSDAAREAREKFSKR